jgi:hypothetical protein
MLNVGEINLTQVPIAAGCKEARMTNRHHWKVNSQGWIGALQEAAQL